MSNPGDNYDANNDELNQPLYKTHIYMIPLHMRAAMLRYIEHGVQPGVFLEAVLTNNLTNAVLCADNMNQSALVNYVNYLYRYAPWQCWGSEVKYNLWCQAKGLESFDETPNKD